MRWLAALLLLSACGSKSDERESGAGATPAGLEGLAEETLVQSPEQLQARAAAAVGVIAKDPRFADLRGGPLNSVCGQVDSKLPNGKYSGPRPFVVTPEGVAVISSTPSIMFDDPADPFPDLYIRWCATPEEMQSIGPAITRSTELPPPAVDLPPETIDPVPTGSWGVVPGAAPPPAPAIKMPEPPVAAAKNQPAAAPAPVAKRQPGDEDSFMKSVIRAEESKAGN